MFHLQRLLLLLPLAVVLTTAAADTNAVPRVQREKAEPKIPVVLKVVTPDPLVGFLVLVILM